jgi:hypothetical protein
LGHLHSTIKGFKMSRAEMLQRAGAPLGLPELGAEAYLVEAMMRLGPTQSTGMGEVPSGWPEIDAFARQTGRISDPWEAEALYDMCRAYAAERQAGEDPAEGGPIGR